MHKTNISRVFKFADVLIILQFFKKLKNKKGGERIRDFLLGHGYYRSM